MRGILNSFMRWFRSHQIQAALIGGCFVLLVAWGPGIFRWIFPEQVDAITVERQVVYARIQQFSDRERGGQSFGKRFVGMPNRSKGREFEIYDEAIYLLAYYLAPHQIEKMQFDVRSSGRCSVTPIIPTRVFLDEYEYQQSGWQRLTGEVFLKDPQSNEYANYVLLSQHYFNGFQYNAEAHRYESDGGIKLKYSAKELTLVFDFSGINFLTEVDGTPEVTVRRNGERDSEENVGVTYENGVVTTDELRNLPAGTIIQCKWKWVGEDEVIALHESNNQ